MVKQHRIAANEEATFKVPLLLDGVETPIAGWALELAIDADPELPDNAAFTATVGNGRVTDYSAVAWFARVPAASIAPGLYYFAYRATSPTGVPHVLERGRFIVEPALS